MCMYSASQTCDENDKNLHLGKRKERRVVSRERDLGLNLVGRKGERHLGGVSRIKNG